MTIIQNDEKKIKEEIGEVYAWSSQMSRKISQELIDKGDPPGLDTHREHYKEISKERDKRIHDILVKYGYREK